MFDIKEAEAVNKTFTRKDSNSRRTQNYDLKYRKTKKKGKDFSFFLMNKELFYKLNLDKDEIGLLEYTIRENKNDSNSPVVKVAVQIVKRNKAKIFKKSGRGAKKNPVFTNPIMEKHLIEAGILKDEYGNQFLKMVKQVYDSTVFELVKDNNKKK